MAQLQCVSLWLGFFFSDSLQLISVGGANSYAAEGKPLLPTPAFPAFRAVSFSIPLGPQAGPLQLRQSPETAGDGCKFLPHFEPSFNPEP